MIRWLLMVCLTHHRGCWPALNHGFLNGSDCARAAHRMNGEASPDVHYKCTSGKLIFERLKVSPPDAG